MDDTSDWHDFDSVERAKAYLVASGYREVGGEWHGPVRVADGFLFQSRASILECDGEFTVCEDETDVSPDELGPDDMIEDEDGFVYRIGNRL